MNLRILIISASLIVCGFSIAGVVLQARQLDTLRQEAIQLRQKLDDERARQTNSVAEPKPLTSSPSSELLRLRNEVSQLSRRQRELASVEPENERLQTQIATARTNTAKPLPRGYIRKSEARNMGYSTPEATLQTMLWAIQNRDLTNFVAVFSPQLAADFLRELQNTSKSTADFFQGAGAVPGMNILERNVTGPDTIELKVEIVPGDVLDPETMEFRLINGEWKLESK
jgi:hypothetical protein